jgi:cytochrome c biogenesis protein CcmG, thiol:disulfide interchange protein DsbE
MVARWTLGLLLLAAPAGPLMAQAPLVGQKAPTVSVPDLDGRAVPISVSSGKHAAVVEFWATWCEVCRALMPSMRAAEATWGGRVDFYGVNVTVNERKERVRQYVTQNKPPFRTLFDEKGVAVRAFGAMATSYVVIIDAAGKITYTGEGSDQKISAELARIVGK